MDIFQSVEITLCNEKKGTVSKFPTLITLIQNPILNGIPYTPQLPLSRVGQGELASDQLWASSTSWPAYGQHVEIFK